MKFPRWLLAQLYFTHYLSIYSWISHSKIMPFQRPKNFLPYAIFPILFIVLTFIWSAAVIQKECSHTPVDFIILWKTMTLCRRHPPSFCKSPWRAIIIKVCLDSFWHTVSPNKLGGGGGGGSVEWMTQNIANSILLTNYKTVWYNFASRKVSGNVIKIHIYSNLFLVSWWCCML